VTSRWPFRAVSPHPGGGDEPGYPTPGWLVFASHPLRSYSQPRTYRHNKVSKLKSNFQLKHNTKVQETHPLPEGMMTTLFSSWGTMGGWTRWLVLNWQEDVDPKADPSPPPPHHIAPHHPRAPPLRHWAPPCPHPRPPPPQSPILCCQRGPRALQHLSPPLVPQPPPPPPA
jgi:hypothetical protein